LSLFDLFLSSFFRVILLCFYGLVEALFLELFDPSYLRSIFDLGNAFYFISNGVWFGEVFVVESRSCEDCIIDEAGVVCV